MGKRFPKDDLSALDREMINVRLNDMYDYVEDAEDPEERRQAMRNIVDELKRRRVGPLTMIFLLEIMFWRRNRVDLLLGNTDL